MTDLDVRSGDQPEGPSAGQYAELARAMGSFTHLMLLDGVWTRQAQLASNEVDEVRSRRVSDLSAVIDTLDVELQGFSELCGSLESVFTDQAATLNHGFDRATADVDDRRLTEDQTSMLQRAVAHDGGDFAASVTAAAGRLRVSGATERASIRAEFERLSNGAISEGDFSQEVETDLLWVAAGASVLFGPEAGVVVEGVAHLGELAVGLFHAIFG